MFHDADGNQISEDGRERFTAAGAMVLVGLQEALASKDFNQGEAIQVARDLMASFLVRCLYFDPDHAEMITETLLFDHFLKIIGDEEVA